jgi:hypothetical protein
MMPLKHLKNLDCWNLLSLTVLPFFLAIAVANARNDPPPASDRSWAPPGLPKYEAELAERSFNKTERASNISINPRKVYKLAELIDIAERTNPEPRVAWERARQAAAAEWQTGVETMSGCRQRKLRLSFAPSPLQCEAGQIDTHSKDDVATSCFRSTFKCQRR